MNASRHAVVDGVFGAVRVRVQRIGSGRMVLPAVADSVLVHGVRKGRATLDAPASALLRTGDMVLTGGAVTVQGVIDQPTEVVTVVIPAIGGEGDRSVRIVGASALTRGMMAFVLDALGSEVTDDRADQHVELLLRDMAARLLVVDVVDEAVIPPIAKATAVISWLYAESDLSVTRIAEEVNLSVRQLGRLFRARGTSVGQVVRRTRLEAASRMLGEPAYAALDVNQIAQRVGFGSGSSLARAMAREGMGSPLTHRAAALARV